MGILARITSEPRYPQSTRVSASPRTMAGVTITPDVAVTIATVWACLRYLSQTVAALPWQLFLDGDLGPEVQRGHRVHKLIYDRVSREWSSFQFRETLLHWALRWGNGYAEIERDQFGQAFALWPIHPERCEVCRDKETGELYYEVTNGAGEKVEIAYMDMFHVRGFGEGPVGVNVIQYASQSLGWARAAQLYGATFFGNGMNASGFVTLKKGLGEAGFKRMRAELDQLYKGVRNSNKAIILDNEADWKAIGIDPQKSQLLELHQHLVEETCRWFGVPPHKVMHLLRATFTNIEHQAIEVVVDSVSPWVRRFEDEAKFKLLGDNRRGYYTKMNLRALMRGDAAARIAFYKGMFDTGAYSPNHILRLEDENTIGPDGDKHLVQGALVPLDQAGVLMTRKADGQTTSNDDPGDQSDANDPLLADRVDEIARLLAQEPAHAE